MADPDGRAEIVVNVQGDLPMLQPRRHPAALGPLADPAVDIATLALEITEEAERTDPNVVKAICSPVAPGRFRALYFTRATAPSGEGPLYHHIGLYAYRRAALARFVALPPSPLERRERLEQLRALEAGMRIDVALTQNVIFGVDTPEHLEKARAAARRVDLERDRRATEQTHEQTESRVPGRARREFRHRGARGLSRLRAAALPDLRGRAGGDRRAARPISA